MTKRRKETKPPPGRELTEAEEAGYDYAPHNNEQGLHPDKRAPGRGRTVEVNVNRFGWLRKDNK